MRCEICNAILDDETEMKEHLKLHVNKNSEKPSHNEESIDDAVNGRLECSFCKVYVSSVESMKIHELGANHKKKVMMYERNKAAENKCGIYITGFKTKPNEAETINYFSKYGKIVWSNVSNYNIQIDYENPESAKTVIETDHFLHGHRLKVSYRQYKTNDEKKIIEVEEPMLDLTSPIENISDINQQFAIVRKLLWESHHNESGAKQRVLLTDIEKSVRSYYSKAKIHIFGSSITGLNFPTSDVDIYIGNIQNRDKKQVSHLYRIKGLLLKFKKFNDIIVIGSAKTPIVKCTHVTTKLKCDINIKNELGVCNSILIKNILSIDEKLKDVMLFLKYFFRIHSFTGQSYFNNYAICIMFIFYLQVLQKLPPIYEFNKDLHYKNIQDGWNCGLEPFNSNYFKHHFTESYTFYLKGFFKFYADFKYETNAICPFVGTILNKDDLLNPELFPNVYTYYKSGLLDKLIEPIKNTHIMVQDPFEHNRNITGNIKTDLLLRFVEHCRFAYEICEEGEAALLFKLITKKVPVKNFIPLIVSSSNADFTLHMGQNLKYLDQSDLPGEAWFKVVCQFIKIVLEEFLKFEISEVDEQQESKNVKLSNQKDVHDQPMRLILHCSTKINLWSCRQCVPKSLSKKLIDYDFIQSELIMTESLCQKINYENSEVLTSFKLVIEHKNDANAANFFLNPTFSQKKTFKSFKKFFIAKIPIWFLSYQKYLAKVKENSN